MKMQVHNKEKRSVVSDKKLIVRVSKKLSSVLRHGIDREGLRDCFGDDAYVPLKRVLALRKFRGVNMDQIRTVVEGNDKQRFSMAKRDGKWFIRANQGHSVAGVDAEKLLERIEIDANAPPIFALHGTYKAVWNDIAKTGGLLKMGRQHVHLAQGMPEEGGVISGMRKSCQLVVRVNMTSAVHRGGLVFYRSANGVILTPGLGDAGLLPIEFFESVVDRATGKSYALPK